VELMPEFDRLAGMLEGSARGIPIHLPLGSVGEYNIFGHLGMIGLPLAPVTAFPQGAATPIFTRHSLAEPDLGARLLERVRAGREVFLTWALLRALGASEMGRVFNIIADEGVVSSSRFRAQELPWDYKTVDVAQAVTFPRIALSTWPYIREVALVREDADFGVLLRAPYLDG